MDVVPPRSLVDLVNVEASTVVEVFDARVRASGTRTFLVWGDQSWSYADARQMAIGLGGFLQEKCGKKGIRVASYLSNRPEAMWTWLGTLYAGGVLIAVNRQHQGSLLEDMIVRARAKALITDRAALIRLPTLDRMRAAGIQLLILVDGDDRADSHPTIETVPFSQASSAAAWRTANPQPSDLACVMYTSGTTGRSKAVMIPQNQYCRNAARLVDAYGLTESDVFHNWLPLYHLGGQLHMTMTAIIAGGTVALFPSFSTSRFLQEVAATRVTVLCGFAAILHFIDSLPPSATDASSSLRVGIMAGIPMDMHRRFESRFGMQLGENYGMTEVDPITQPTPGIQTPMGSCGLPSPDIEINICDAAGTVVPNGTMGEIVLRQRVADVMAIAYEGDPDATARAWRGGWFHTGDFGTQDSNGFLYFKGRAGNYIRRRGENVSVDELCTLLLRHEAVEECAAVAVPSDVGEDDIKVVIVPRAGATVTPAQLHTFSIQTMAPFMVPRYIEIRDALPRSDVGKVKLQELHNLGKGVWDSAAIRRRSELKES